MENFNKQNKIKELPNLKIGSFGYGYNYLVDTITVANSLTLNHCLRNINHEFLHRVLFIEEGLEACVCLDNFKHKKTYITDIVVGHIERKKEFI